MSVLIYCGLIMSAFCFGRLLALSAEMEEMVKMLHDSCVEESGVDEGLIAKANNKELVEDGKLKCYMKCLMDQVSAMDDDGTIDVEVLISMLPDELSSEIEPVIRTCGTVKGSDDCDTVFQTQKCYMTNAPDKYFLV